MAPALADKAGQYEPVRAIADGVVVYRRTPTPISTDEDHALNFYKATVGARWTHDGVVVIKHDTEIGEGETARLTFYSIIQHLSSLDERLPAKNQRIWRKDKIGTAGSIYGEPNRIHFEIVAAPNQIQRISGRSTRRLPTTRGGRRDAMFGDSYVRLPAGTRWMREVLFRDDRHQQRAAAGELGPGIVHTSTETLYVGLHYEQGDCAITTYQERGAVVGRTFTEPEQTEYNLSTIAARRYPDSPSAGYELLRFGVVTGPDALNPADAAHWRQVPYAGGLGWVNLNAQGIFVYSDADMPDWRGWQLIDDDTEGDVRCDSAAVEETVESRFPDFLPQDAIGVIAALTDETVRDVLQRMACLFPTEWADTEQQIDARYAWVKDPAKQGGMDQDDYSKLKRLIKTLGFWTEAAIADLPSTHWHMNPRLFICHFRKCGWMSLSELSQLLPRRHGNSANHLNEINWEKAQERFRRYQIDLNKTMRKYGIVSQARRIHFLAQSYIETALWSTMVEIGRAHQQRRRDGTLYWPAPAMQYYLGFYGRGAMQLTWAANYDGYGNFRKFPSVDRNYQYSDTRITRTSTHYWSDPRDGNGNVVGQAKAWSPRFDPQQIADDAFNACDSAGYYWVAKSTGHGLNINRVADGGLDSNSVGRASVLVNGGGYGFAERQAYAAYINRYLGDATSTAAAASFVVTYSGHNHNVYVDYTQQRPH